MDEIKTLQHQINELQKQLDALIASKLAPQPTCEECGSEDCEQYWYDNHVDTFLCEEHATGMFCLFCGTLTGGTEDIFRYGAWKCSQCIHTHEEYESNDDDWYDDFDPYEDWERNYGE